MTSNISKVLEKLKEDGKIQGKIEGKAEILIKLLSKKFKSLPEEYNRKYCYWYIWYWYYWGFEKVFLIYIKFVAKETIT